jgi:hypothetical protein
LGQGCGRDNFPETPFVGLGQPRDGFPNGFEPAKAPTVWVDRFLLCLFWQNKQQNITFGEPADPINEVSKFSPPWAILGDFA